MVFIGIDLGTSNSALATFDGDTVAVVPNALGETLTPSAVRIDPGGAPTVGRRAAWFLDSDPGNTHAEFKRLMGTAERLRFAASGQALLPEELSGHVLASLLADARDALGWPPRAAVISTPALFELPQNHATTQAGRRAGLEQVVLIQEPIASAIAAGWRETQPGTWLVFDLGGGTLDVSLLSTRDGRMRVVDHAGDNFLGGRDMDRLLVDWTLDQMGAQPGPGGGPGLDRANPGGRRALARLKVACEQAKIALTRAERASVVVADLAIGGGAGEARDVDVPISRATFAALIEPLVLRGVAVVRDLLTRNRLSPDDVARVVFVGGPTLIPSVRGPVAALFGGRVAEGIDPMTIVARGAALYAGTIGLDAAPAPASARGPAGLAVRIEHPPVTADRQPFVVGRFLPAEGQPVPARVRLQRGDGGWCSADVPVSAERSFVVQVSLEPHRQNRFQLLADWAGQAPLAIAGDRFSVVHGVSVADPPLSRSLGIACADDTTRLYFAKGTPLPARRTFVHTTVQPLRAGHPDDALVIPVVQGESLRAHRNRLVGELRVRGVARDLPAGSRVEVTLFLDRSGQLHTRADVPAVGQSFEDVVHVLVPAATLETTTRALGATEARAAALQRRVFQAGATAAIGALAAVPALLAEAARDVRAAAGGDSDAAQRAHRLLLDADLALDDAEALLAWPDLEREAGQFVVYYTPLVARFGTSAEQHLFDQALQASVAARQRRDRVELERQLQAMRSIGEASYCRDPQSLPDELDWAAAHVTDALDVVRATQLLDKARTLLGAGDRAALAGVLARLWDLFPCAPEQRARSFDSGVR